MKPSRSDFMPPSPMANVSAALMETALEIASELDAVAPGEWAPVRVALIASALYEALKSERAKADSIEAALVLDGAIERCRRTADPLIRS